MSEPSPLLLICSATSIETRAVREGIAGSKVPFEILETGMGEKRAGDALKRRLSDRSLKSPQLVISTGFAGIQAPRSGHEIRLGSWLLGQSTSPGENPLPLDTAFLSGLLADARIKAELAHFWHVSQVTEAPRVRRQTEILTTTLAMDMESYPLAVLCKEFRVPISVLRMVSDTPSLPLPRSISAFARVSLDPSLLGKLGGACLGMTETLSHPLLTANFLGRGRKLSLELQDGWRAIAQAFNSTIRNSASSDGVNTSPEI